MARSPNASPVPSLPDPAASAREILRALLAENAALIRELEDLRRLRQASDRDALGSLAGVWSLEQRIGQQLTRARHEPSHRWSLLVVGVDEMKVRAAGEAGGHGDERGAEQDGDGALGAVADALLGVLRPEDTCSRT